MKWIRASSFVRFASLVLAAGCLLMAWRLTLLGASGAEDIPPPFTLAFGLAGIVLLAVGIIGRIPRT